MKNFTLCYFGLKLIGELAKLNWELKLQYIWKYRIKMNENEKWWFSLHIMRGNKNREKDPIGKEKKMESIKWMIFRREKMRRNEEKKKKGMQCEKEREVGLLFFFSTLKA